VTRSDWTDYFPEDLDPYYKRPRDREDAFPSGLCLRDVLLRQLRIATDDEKLLRSGKEVIDSIDDSGYLRDPDALFKSRRSKKARKRLEAALSLVQTFEPAGVGARDLKECLLLQIQRRLGDGSAESKLVEEHLESIQKRDYAAVARGLGVPVKRVMQALDFIKKLTPQPGVSYVHAVMGYGTVPSEPHVIIVERDGELVHMINEDAFSTPELPESYREAWLDLFEMPKEARSFLRRSFRAYMSAMDKKHDRYRILEKLSDFFIELQADFLKRGLKYLRPMDISVVADQIGCTRREIRNAVRGTYIKTLAGTFDFSEVIGHSSALVLKERINELIHSEDRSNPLSDRQICLTLCAQGFSARRRTVCEYRRRLSIPTSRIRKRDYARGGR
jgi:RNA polymerase sigma-54 factor